MEIDNFLIATLSLYGGQAGVDFTSLEETHKRSQHGADQIQIWKDAIDKRQTGLKSC